MANSPGDYSKHDGDIGFHSETGSAPTVDEPDNTQDFSPYADDTSDPTSPQSQDGYRSRAWGEDTKQIGTNRME